MTFIKKNSYLLSIFTLCLLFALAAIIKSNHEGTYKEVVVNEGETLWHLAVKHAEQMPADRWIEEVKKLNQLTSNTIRVGEELLLPIKDNQPDRNQIATNITSDGN